MLFYKTTPSEKNIGMKFVLFEVVTDESVVIHDWGFAQWTGKEWVEVDKPEGFTCTVIRWANTVNPDVLLKEGKIIKI